MATDNDNGVVSIMFFALLPARMADLLYNDSGENKDCTDTAVERGALMHGE